MTFAAKITATGAYLPERILTNAELATMVDTDDEWIRERTGIRDRRIAVPDETSSTLGAEAARRARGAAGSAGSEIDLVLVGTCTPDGMFPAVASRIQHTIGATNAGAFDVNAACTGYLSAFSTATQFIANGTSRRVMVIGSETLSRIVERTDRGTCVLFGDGAGTTLLEQAPPGEPGSIESLILRCDGSYADSLYASEPAGIEDRPLARNANIVMDGRAVFRAAVEDMSAACRTALDDAGLGIEDIALCVPHQANELIIRAVARNLGLEMERVFMNVERYGNTSSATIPIALHEANVEGRLKPGDHVLMTAIGGGLTWGALVAEWGNVRVHQPVTMDAALASGRYPPP
jgi:3-oxoacyl-[acyl-carrier-protein] synthase-3